MRRCIVPILLLGLFFFFPFQVFIIGSETGIGIQGAVYRVQVTGYGDSLILITQEIMYVVNGLYSVKTGSSVLLWALGSCVLALITWFGIVSADSAGPEHYRRISLGLIVACVCYLGSCIAQYGVFFHGAAGTSIPLGVALVLLWLAAIRFFPEILTFRQ